MRSRAVRTAAQREMCTYAGHPPVDLGGVLTLGVGVLGGGHLQHAHAKGVHVHGLVVLLLVHLWSHELWGSWGKYINIEENSCSHHVKGNSVRPTMVLVGNELY